MTNYSWPSVGCIYRTNFEDASRNETVMVTAINQRFGQVYFKAECCSVGRFMLLYPIEVRNSGEGTADDQIQELCNPSELGLDES